jgi:hypothetical protein
LVDNGGIVAAVDMTVYVANLATKNEIVKILEEEN